MDIVTLLYTIDVGSTHVKGSGIRGQGIKNAMHSWGETIRLQ